MPRILPAEWEEQSGVMLTWPHSGTDWAAYLTAAEKCFAEIAKEIALREKLLIVCHDIDEVKPKLRNCNMENIVFFRAAADDTWARDHGAITVYHKGNPVLLDFTFNGWGKKFPATYDNRITKKLFEGQVFSPEAGYEDNLDFVFEGGSIESDGQGTILTTAECLLSPQRNPGLGKKDIERRLRDSIGARRVLWIHHGFLAGDDTDSHIDTLARFCDPQTIAYVKCENKDDIHFEALERMERDLQTLKTADGKQYKLVPLPMAEPAFYGSERLPATYANFLIINGAVLVPQYGTESDTKAVKVLKKVFKDREIIGIDCSVLIRQHGSLHCVTMQFPKGIL